MCAHIHTQGEGYVLDLNIRIMILGSESGHEFISSLSLMENELNKNRKMTKLQFVHLPANEAPDIRRENLAVEIWVKQVL